MILKKQTKRQHGSIGSTELLLVSTVVVVGLLAGWVAIRDGAIAEIIDVSQAVESIDQSYCYDGISATEAGVTVATLSGGKYVDQVDSSVSTSFVQPTGEALPPLPTFNLGPGENIRISGPSGVISDTATQTTINASAALAFGGPAATPVDVSGSSVTWGVSSTGPAAVPSFIPGNYLLIISYTTDNPSASGGNVLAEVSANGGAAVPVVFTPSITSTTVSALINLNTDPSTILFNVTGTTPVVIVSGVVNGDGNNVNITNLTLTLP